MSFPSDVVTHISGLWGLAHKIERRLGLIDRGLQSMESRANQLIAQIGDAAYGPFSYSPPPFCVQIHSNPYTGTWLARRLAVVSGSLLPDDEDEGLYQIQPLPWTSGMFIGARGWVQHTHIGQSHVPDDVNNNTAIYSPLDGEWRVFAGQTTSDGPTVTTGGKHYYGWSQTNSLFGYHHESGKVIFEGEPNQVTLGLAQLVTQAGWDIEETSFERVDLPAGTPCLIWYDGTDDEFKMMQAVERKVFLCQP
ncbi:MAG: hypothetical protein H6819_06665 [Phycisphaerales bacterium]|nr:hypothetical protein [Phycisphaerales bacterium]MCB9855263.1 hypothetical protein [Phycisphaerales bacterium]MCB9862856.1 hypothetical protein [Phycisphaerales bacterium]